jgi:ABC-type amino acid transport substrate-binding protein
MINDQKDETIRRLLNMFAAAKQAGAGYYGEPLGPRAPDQMQTTPSRSKTNHHQRWHEGLTNRIRGRTAGGGGGETSSAVASNASRSGRAAEIKSDGHLGGAASGHDRPVGRAPHDGDRLAPAELGGPNRLAERDSVMSANAGAGRDNLEQTTTAGELTAGAALPRATASSSSLNEPANVSADAMLGPIERESHGPREGPAAGGARAPAAEHGTSKSIKTRATSAGEDALGGKSSRHSQQLSFGIELEPMIEFLHDRQSALEADEKVCQLIESGVYAIFGPVDGRSIQHIQSICDNLEIPYFELRPFIGGGGSSIGGGGLASSPIAGLPLAPLPPSQHYVPSPSSLVNATPSKRPDHYAANDNADDDSRDETSTRQYSDEASEEDEDLEPDDGDSHLYPEKGVTLDGGSAKAKAKAKAVHGRRQAAAAADSNSQARLGRMVAAGQPAEHDRHHQMPGLANKLEALTLNLYPPSHLLNTAYIDLIHALNWTSFAIVYEDNASMIKLQNIFKESSPVNSWTNKWRIRLFRHDPDGIYGEYNNNEARGSSSDRTDESLNRRKFVHQPEAGADMSRVSVAAAAGAPPSGASANTNSHRRNLSKLSFVSDDQVSDNNGRQQQLSQTEAAANYHEEAAALLQAADRLGGGSAAPQAPRREAGGANRKSAGGTYRDVFWRVKLSGEHNILLDIKTENLFEALKQAQQVGCMTEEYSYLVTSLDLHTIDLEDFKYSRTKITALSLTQVPKNRPEQLAEEEAPHFDERYLENLGVYLIQQMNDNSASMQTNLASQRGRERQHQQRNASKLKGQKQPVSGGGVDDTRYGEGRDNSGHAFDWVNEAENNDQTRRELLQSSPASLGLLPTVDRNNEQKLFDFFLEQQERNLSRVRLSTSSAVIHDSLILYMLGLNEMDPSGKFLQNDGRQDRPIYCSLDSQPWLHGSSLVNYMKQMTFNGLTGYVSFDQRGLRNDFKLDVLGMAPNIRLVKIGEWHSRYASDEQRGKFGAQAQHVSHQSVLATHYQRVGTKARPPAASSKAGHHHSTNHSESPGAHSPPPTMAGAETADTSGLEDSKSYDELSSRYENELRLYNQMLERGEQVHVPYRKRVSPNGALSVNNIIFERLYREQADKIDTLIVTAKLSQPYFMLRETPNKLDGNDQFEGYAVDLIHELSKLVNFKYKWREVADKKYGSKEVLPNGTIVWNGMIGEIVRGVADLAIVDLTITAQREEAVDFTLPFMNTGISILFKKPTTKVTTLFSFLSPFSSDVWAYVLAAYCGISAILFLVGHLSPYEWADPHPCRHLNPDSDLTVLKNQFSLLNSFWFTIGSLMQQGSDLTPRSMSTRTIAGIWYFFTLIMISSYTANLAAFLTVEKVVYPIENVRDLSNQQEIKYGCVESGSTCLFFHDSQIDTYKKIDETMRRHRTYVRSNDEGQKRVGEGKFAFFMESTTIEYIIERNCNLTQIGGLLDSKGYGIALAKKSRHKRPYRTLLNEGILHLQETGMLHVLKNRWWKEKRGGGTCTDDGKGGGVTELSLANVGGVFVVLLGGLGISFLVAIAEFIWRARRGGSSRDRMCEEMMNDLKFALACKSSTKPIQKVAGSKRQSGSSGAGNKEDSADHSSSNNNRTKHRNNFDSNLMRQRFAHERQRTISGAGPNAFAGQRHVYRQEPVLSRSSKCLADVDAASEAALQAAAGKRCNPILLHAMLTMLSTDETRPPPAAAGTAYGPGNVALGTNSRPGSMVAAPFAAFGQGKPTAMANNYHQPQPMLSGTKSFPAYLDMAAAAQSYGSSSDDKQLRALATTTTNDVGHHVAGRGLMNNNGSVPDSEYVDDEDDGEDVDVGGGGCDDDEDDDEYGGAFDEDEALVVGEDELDDDDDYLGGDLRATRPNNARADTTDASGLYRMTKNRINLTDLCDNSRRRMLHSQKTIDTD